MPFLFSCLRLKIHVWGTQEKEKSLRGFWEKHPKEGIFLVALTPILLPIPISRFAHGGSLAAMMDETFSKTAYLAGEGLFTLSLNIRFKK